MDEAIQRYDRRHRRLKPIANAERSFTVGRNPLEIVAHPVHWKTSHTFKLQDSLAGLVPIGLGVELATALGRYYCRFAWKTAVYRHLAFTAFLKSFRLHVSLQGRVSPFQNLNHTSGPRVWNDAFEAHLTSVRAKRTKLTSKVEETGALYLVCVELASCGLTPQVGKPKHPKNYHFSAKQKKSLPEIVVSKGNLKHQKAVVQAVSHLKGIGIQVGEGDEAESYIQSLAASIDLTKIDDEESYFTAILDANRAQLAAIRYAAESEYLKWREHYLLGQRCSATGDPTVAQAFDQRRRNGGDGRSFFIAYFYRLSHEESLANFLRLCIERFHSRVPSENEEIDWRGPRLRLLQELGGKYYVDAMLSIHRDGVGAGITIYLVDTGANTSTATEMHDSFESPVDEAGMVLVQSSKPRAGYEPIIDTLPEYDKAHRIGTVQVLRQLKEMTKLKRKTHPELKNYIFVFTFFTRPSIADGDFILNQFRRIMAEHRLPKEWYPSAIRLSVAMEASRLSVGTTSNVKRVLKHKEDSADTTNYSHSYPIRKLLEKRIRDYQEVLQAAFSSHVEGALVSMGKSASDSKKLIEKAVRTGLGVLCANPNEGVQPGTKKGSNCNKVGECAGCSQRLLVINPETLAEIVAVHDFLSAKQFELEASNRHAWKSIWIDLYAFSIVAIGKVKRSRHAHLLPAARKRAQQLIEHGFDPTLLKP